MTHITLHRTRDIYTGTQEILGNGGGGDDDDGHDNETNKKYPRNDIWNFKVIYWKDLFSMIHQGEGG